MLNGNSIAGTCEPSHFMIHECVPEGRIVGMCTYLTYIGKVYPHLRIRRHKHIGHRVQYKLHNECLYYITIHDTGNAYIYLIWETISQYLTLLISFAYFRKLMIVL